MDQKEWRKILNEGEIFGEITVGEAKIVLKPKEMGEGVSVTVHIDSEGYLVLKDKEGQMIFLHPDQIPQLKKFLQKVK